MWQCTTLQKAVILLGFFLVTLFSLSTPFNRTKMTSSDSLRFVIVSDTHRSFSHPIPDGDVWIHAGDSELTASEMDSWAASLPHKHKLVVCGNMDRRLEREKHKLQNVTYLQDSHVVLSGIKVYGSPWTPEFVGVFQMESGQVAHEVWEKVPPDVDVLITHGPPKGVLDRTSRGFTVGDEHLRRVVEQIKPRLHCFGHVHESYGTMQTDDTIFCNAAVFNGKPPIVVDVPLNKNLAASVL